MKHTFKIGTRHRTPVVVGNGYGDHQGDGVFRWTLKTNCGWGKQYDNELVLIRLSHRPYNNQLTAQGWRGYNFRFKFFWLHATVNLHFTDEDVRPNRRAA